MRKVFRFQRYSQKENWSTNNTVLLLSLLYQYNQSKFQDVLNSILTENKISLEVGVQFYQQERSVESVFDATMEQKSFKIAVEAKRYNDFKLLQLEGHVKGLYNSDCQNKILLMLSKNEITKDKREEINNYIIANGYQDVRIASTSYSNLIEIVSEQIKDYEYEFKETIVEYSAFCEENKLIDKRNSTMLVLACGTSFNENLKYNLFYDPAERSNNSPFKYLGLYHNKMITHIGEVLKIVQCDLVGNKLAVINNTGEPLTDSENERIKNIILNTKYYNIRGGCKFYVVEKFYPTNFVKKSFQAMRNKRYFILDELENYNTCFDTEQLANFLEGKYWE